MTDTWIVVKSFSHQKLLFFHLFLKFSTSWIPNFGDEILPSFLSLSFLKNLLFNYFLSFFYKYILSLLIDIFLSILPISVTIQVPLI